MRITIVVVLLACGLAAGVKGNKMPTTKPATKAGCLSKAELLALADEALAMELPVKGVDRYWLVAVALVESGGDPNAVGDGGLAVGLHQFHDAAWLDCWGEHTLRPRTDALSSLRAAIRYAGKVESKLHLSPVFARARFSSHHHLGHIDLGDKKYINRVEWRFQTLVKEYGGK